MAARWQNYLRTTEFTVEELPPFYFLQNSAPLGGDIRNIGATEYDVTIPSVIYLNELTSGLPLPPDSPAVPWIYPMAYDERFVLSAADSGIITRVVNPTDTYAIAVELITSSGNPDDVYPVVNTGTVGVLIGEEIVLFDNYPTNVSINLITLGGGGGFTTTWTGVIKFTAVLNSVSIGHSYLRVSGTQSITYYVEAS